MKVYNVNDIKTSREGDAGNRKENRSGKSPEKKNHKQFDVTRKRKRTSERVESNSEKGRKGC